MSYHSERFSDASVMVFRDDALLAALPANIDGSTIYSHQGLTFGGLLTSRATTNTILEVFDLCLDHYMTFGAKRLIYKPLPSIYHREQAEADLYCLFRSGAKLIRRDVTTTIDYRQPWNLSSRRRRGISKAHKIGLTVGMNNRWTGFWDILEQTLRARHGVAPVHSLGEIEMLAARFPDNIRLFTAEHDNALRAGVVIFETQEVAHAQYIASSDEGRSSGALDLLFDWLIRYYASSKRYFDFGISTEDEGRTLNHGLLTQKEEFGGKPIMHDAYLVEL